MYTTNRSHTLKSAMNLNSRACKTKEEVDNESCGTVGRLYQTTCSWESSRRFPVSTVVAEKAVTAREAAIPPWSVYAGRPLELKFSDNFNISPAIYAPERGGGDEAQDTLSLCVLLSERVILCQGAGTGNPLRLVPLTRTGLVLRA